jgi:hypothetical protein
MRRKFVNKTQRIACAAAVVAASLAAGSAPALALPPIGTDPIPHCPRGYVWTEDGCVPIAPPPPPQISPVVAIDLARQTTNRAAVHVTGSAKDGDASAQSLTVQIRVDNGPITTIVADKADPPVATPNALVGVGGVTPPGHRYDLNVPAPAGAQQVCVTALNVGSGSNTTLCRAIDRVVEFAGNSISYDVANVQITDTHLDSLDRVTNTNATNVQQSTTISGEKTVTETQGWSDTEGVKVTVSGGVKIPFISDFKVTVEGSLSFTQNGSTATARKFAWSQPVLVPAHSKVVASVAVTSSTLLVPYTISGNFVYQSGVLAPGTTSGTYSGVNSHDLEVNLAQFNLDGTPALAPIQQPQAKFLRSARL